MTAALRRASLHHLAAHRLRTLITTASIALGVATMIGMRLVHESAATSYQRTVERIAGKAALQVTNGEVGVPEELLEEVRAVPGVRAAVASVQGFVSLRRPPGERLYVFGVDLLADDELREYAYGTSAATVEDPLVFLAQPDSVGLTDALLAETGLQPGDRIEVLAPTGRTELTVRARLDARTGPASLFGGRVALMDVFAAQRLFRLERRFTQIDVGLAEGVEAEAVEVPLRHVVGSRGAVERPATRGQTLETILASNRYGMTLGATLAIVVGLYVIFNTMMIAVVERQREFGVLRAVGMLRGQLLRLVVGEAAALGAAGCLLGVPLGYALARAVASGFAATVSGMYVAVEVPEIRLEAASVLWGVVLGLGSAVVAALVPARDAVRTPPLETLRPAAHPRGAGTYRRAALAGAVVTVLALGSWVGRALLPLPRAASGVGATLGCLVGVSLLVPALVRAFALRSEPLLGGLLGPVGVLASRGIADHVGRVAITCSAFLVSLAGAIMIATWLASFQRTLTAWLDGLFANIDLVISSGARPLSPASTPVPGRLAAELAALPGVARVDAVRSVKIELEGRLTALIATDARLYGEGVRELALLEGDPQATVDALARRAAVVVNEAFARRFGKRPGDALSFVTPTGELRLPVAAIYFDASFADLGVVLMDRGLYRERWRDDTANFLEPVLAAGADRDAVIEAIRRRWGAEHDLFIATVEEFRREAETLVDQTMTLSYPVVVVSIGIALLGVVNSLLASVLDRVREIGLLRAIGATRAQVARAVVIEAALIGLLAGVLAVGVGSLLGSVQLDVLFRGMFGMTVLYRYPIGAVAFSLVAAVGLAALAGYLPGRRAAGIRVLDALGYE